MAKEIGNLKGEILNEQAAAKRRGRNFHTGQKP